MTALRFTVAGTPAPQGSKRPLRNKHTGRIHMVEMSKQLPTWRDDVRDAAMRAMDGHNDCEAEAGGPIIPTLWNSPLQVTIQFRLPRPKGHYRTGRNAHLLRDTAPAYPAGKPDLDKLVRAVADALTGVVWRDDAQIVAYLLHKTYSDRPGADITIDEAS